MRKDISLQKKELIPSSIAQDTKKVMRVQIKHNKTVTSRVIRITVTDDIVEHTDFNRNLLDNNISIQQVISYGDMSDDETENMMIEQTNALLVILEKNLKYFVHSDVEKEVQKEEKAESVQDDLEEALQQTELDDAKEIPKVATKISSKKSKSHIQKDDEDDDLDELLKELEEENIEDEILEDKKAAFKRESKFNLQNVNNRKPKKKATTPKHEDSLDIDSDKNETTNTLSLFCGIPASLAFIIAQ